MNGFTLMADSYRRLVEQGKVAIEDVKRDIEIYEFLATCNVDDFCRMVDSSAFNDIIVAFVKMAVKESGIDEESQKKVNAQLRWIFDEKQAKEVLESMR